jgi:hypothetical protein
MGFRTFASLMADDPLPAIDRVRVRDLAPRLLADVTRELAPWLSELVTAWETYLQVGGFPRAVSSWLTERTVDPSLLRGLLDVIHGDAFSGASWSRPQTIAFLQRLADGLGTPANHSAIAEDIDTARPTVRRRLADLREAFIVWPAYRQDNLTPNLKAQEKVYFTDPMSEQQLGMALLRGLEADEPGSYVDFGRVLYHRTPTRKEIDFVGPSFAGLAFESKYIDGRWRGEARTLQASPWRGVIATRSELNLDDPTMAALPTAMLAWLIDT